MALKRKRNLKIDGSTSYSVFLSKDLDPDEMEDYVETRDTGMEADEEKEVHLQNIIKGEKKDIPLPVITEVANASRSFFCPKNLRRHIAWEKDCENIYIENKEDLEEEARIINTELAATKERGSTPPANTSSFGEDSSLRLQGGYLDDVSGPSGRKKKHHGEPEAYPSGLFGQIGKMGDNSAYTLNMSDAAINFCLRRSVVRYERRGYEAYTCFRDRIFRPTFKSRRNEALVVGKLERMGMELGTLGIMCNLAKEKCHLELRALKKTTKALEMISSIKMNRVKKKALRKLMVEGPTNNPSPLDLHSIMTNRDRIMAMRNLRVSPELYLDIRYYSEAMELIGEPEDPEQKDKRICRICFGNGSGNAFDSSV